MRTFVYNLNMMTAFSLILLDEHHKEGDGARRWRKILWSKVKMDNNPHFDILAGEEMSMANFNCRMWHPYPGFFSWQKPPSEWWGNDRDVRGPGIDVLLPYWMKRYFNAE